MLPACDVLLCFLFLMTAYGNTLTIGSTVNSTLLDSEIFKEKTANDTCTNLKECEGKLLCEDGICQCFDDFFGTESHVYSATHLPISEHFDGHSCEASVECTENLECRESICQCSESEYWDISKCYTKKDEHSFCNASIECKITLQCRNNHCVCCDQDYWNGQFCGRKGRERDFIVKFHQSHGKPSPRILPANNRKSELNIFYFANNKNVSLTLNSADNIAYILDSNVLMTNGLHQAGVEIHSNVPIILERQIRHSSLVLVHALLSSVNVNQETLVLTGLTLNSSCATAYQCRGKLVCIDGQCKCSENYIWNGTNCIEEKTLNSKCKHTSECDTTLFCIYGTCQCAQMHYWNGNICIAKKTANDTCANTGECDGKLICENGVCQCLVSLFWNGSKCIFKKFEGHSCQSHVECVENLECRESICQCSESEYWDTSKCFAKKSVNDACITEEECSATLHCDGNICQCASSNYWTGSTCSLRKDAYSLCNASLECKATLQCINSHCVCCEQYFWNEEFCERNICAVEQCMNDAKCMISGGNSRCVCKDGYLGDKCQYAEYIVPSFSVFCSSCQSLFALTSVYSNTKIEINFKMQHGSAAFGNKQYSNNETLVLVLNMNTAFQIWHSSDLIGTRITASKPLLVVSGHKYNKINGKGGGQPFLEMVLPTNQLDNVYVIPYLNYRLDNTVRVLAVNDTNVVLKNVNNRTTHVLKSRDFLGYFHSTISYVSSTSDVMVHIYPHELPNAHGDAFMMTIPGINQYLYDYEIMVPIDFESFISITVPTNSVEGFVLDGNFVTLTNIFSISEEVHHFSSFSIPISSGPHHITHREKTRFGLWIYGNFTGPDAYGYSAGMAFKT
ncbi:unnamed protein product [Mytilus edulis]|uniref:EGF-like domain-containing protein n=1 Tax=Mytilus edulis TaxID=6550 RepID=A0A8S3TV21_MYTED|nr:unnamed protein product [Mytilus edulis]